MKKLLLVAATMGILFSCNNESPKEVVEEVEIEETIESLPERIEVDIEKDGYRLTGNNYATSYPTAKLSLKEFDEANLKAGKNTFNFEVANYELQAGTEDELAAMCANSEKGQHIHWILDNQPYTALYEPTHEAELKEGHHVLLAFLSRSYHMSIKNGTAHLIQEFTVGDGEYDDVYNEDKPHLFYSRPKGTYTGADAERIMVDFFLENVELSPDGYTVWLNINGIEFHLTEWMPYFIEGLPYGENEITLTLLDPDGNPVPSPYNGIQRFFELKEE